MQLYVLALGHRLKMLGVDAGGIPAAVVKNLALWDGANQKLVGEAIGVHDVACLDAELPVAVATSVAEPKPTAIGLLNLLPEAFLG